MEENIKNISEENATSQVVETTETKTEKTFFAKVGGFFANTFGTLGRWIGRMFMGASKSVAPKNDDDKFNVEEIVSPTKQIFQNFFRRPYAVVALSVLVVIFLIMFIGPLFMPTYRDDFAPTTQKNLEPNMTMLKVSAGMKNDVKTISSRSFFTFGLDNDGNVYHWGITKMNASGVDVSEIPEEVLDKPMAFVACGTDHVVAIGEDGTVYAWGAHSLGQYVKDEADLAEQQSNAGIVPMPEELRYGGKVDVENVKKLVCGSQATAILMNDGSLYIWGNAKTYTNMDKFVGNHFHDIDFAFTQVVGVSIDRSELYTGTKGVFDQLQSNVDSQALPQATRLQGRKIQSIAAANDGIAVLLEDGTVLLSGNFVSDFMVKKPSTKPGEKIVQISAGNSHFLAVSDKGNVYAWGDNTFGQCNIKTKGGATTVYASGYQSYVVNEDGELIEKQGLKGYLFGTDEHGSDLLKRIISGGKMTLTIGAVAVIISTVIGIIIGVISGYFGGWVDMILMRFEEIVASIPFLPFAMILSALIGSGAFGEVSENMRIFVIMLILGLLSWTGLARLVRGQVLAARENEYVIAARAMGVKEGKIAFKHILPNVISVIIVTLTLDFAGCMLTESSLSYLGFGVQYPRPTWGNMLNATTTLTKISNYWWQWLFPGLFLAITTISINIIGDTLRDVMDPKSSAEK